jgi:hypothetical protein
MRPNNLAHPYRTLVARQNVEPKGTTEKNASSVVKSQNSSQSVELNDLVQSMESSQYQYKSSSHV